ncbi:MAG: hypothetical protein COY40_04530 [Alphaproteobacteria bacterium CG_4_10_14_0_8_um_filter_53_9]|nr:MAG: hypothetical protein COY40_04530 [Alphaproteobacteria bacterium CG_4_10_14_0_8_um_filter_53_9]
MTRLPPLWLAFFLLGCGQQEAGSLPLADVVLQGTQGDVIVRAEVAADTGARARGLMGRQRLCDLCGMIFIFDAPVRAAMWMKNTPLPLDMAFIADGRIVHVAHGTPFDDETVIAAPVPVEAILEVNEGRLEDWGVTVGSFVSLPAR